MKRMCVEVILTWLAIVDVVASCATGAQATVTSDRDVYAIENAHFRLEVDAAAGGRIRSWVLKPGGREPRRARPFVRGTG